MKLVLLMLSLLFSANLFCADNWEPITVTYEHTIASYNMADLEKEKLNIQEKLAASSDKAQQCELKIQLDSVEKAITDTKKREGSQATNYREKVQSFSLEKLKQEKNMYEKGVQAADLSISDRHTLLIILESEIKKRAQ